jgi:hypothetical protein
MLILCLLMSLSQQLHLEYPQSVHETIKNRPHKGGVAHKGTHIRQVRIIER